MSLDGFLTIIGLAIAVLALLTPVARLTLRLQAGRQLAMASVAFLIVLYLEFFEVVAIPCPDTLGGACRFLTFVPEAPFTPEMAAFCVVLLWALVAYCVWIWTRPTIGGMTALRKLVDELARQKRVRDLVDLMSSRLNLVRLVLERRTWPQRLRHWVRPDMPVEVPVVAKAMKARAIQLGTDLGKVLMRPLAKLTPSYHDAAREAERIADILYTDKEVASQIVASEVPFAASMLRARIQQVFSFSDLLLETQIMHADSPLHRELKRTQNLSERTGYFLDSECPILFALLEDCRRAEWLHIWSPVGDPVIRSLTEPNEHYVSFLKGPAGHFDDERWTDPTACAIHFFDVMVRRAALQEVQSHMWLMYTRDFVELLERSYDPALAGSTVEFPCRAARLIYEVFSALGAWVRLAANVAPEGFHASEPGDGGDAFQGIPAWACVAMGQCLEIVVMSDRIGKHFASYMLQCALGDMNALVGSEALSAMRHHLARRLIVGSGVGDRTEYAYRLLEHFASIDHVLQGRSTPFATAGAASYPGIGFEGRT